MITSMLRNYLLTAWRAFRRRTGFAVINILGLGVGMACCLTIMLFVRYELSHDAHYENSDRIYRLVREDSAAGGLMQSASILGLFAPEMKEHVPGIEEYVRLHRENTAIGIGQEVFEENDFYWGDASLFDVFGFRLAQGNPATVLETPGTAVISEDAARAWFGERDPVGETLLVDNQRMLEITGVLAPPRGPSHIAPAVIGSIATLEPIDNPWLAEAQGWTYLMLQPGTSPDDVEAQLSTSMTEFFGRFVFDGEWRRYRLQPLDDVYLRSEGVLGGGDLGDIRFVMLFGAIAALVLLVACINYVNLSTAQSIRRAREVGMRKTLGAHRTQLVAQFLAEAVLTALFSLGIGLMLMEIAAPFFGRMAEQPLDTSLLRSPGLLAAVLGVTVLTGLAAGSWPALVLSRFDPVRTLKGERTAGRSLLRPTLVVVQFAVSVGLLFGSLAIDRQMDFIRDRDLGFDAERLIMIRAAGVESDKETLRREVSSIPGVMSASISMGAPMYGMQSEEKIGGEKYMLKRLMVDAHYALTLGMNMAAGRFYDPDIVGDGDRSIVVNETYARLKGWEDPLEVQIPIGVDSLGNTTYGDVIGVVEDFDTGSTRSAIAPTILDAKSYGARFRNSLIVRIAPDSAPEVIARLEKVVRRHAPGYPFSFTFLDETVQSMYAFEARLGRVFGAFTVIALFIAGLGLFGMATYAAERRTREIGVRKVFGASTTGIVAMLTGDFLKLVLIALVPALPVAWILSERWLENFVYRAEIGPGLAVIVAVSTVLVAWAAVAWQSIRVSRMNPADSLRSD